MQLESVHRLLEIGTCAVWVLMFFFCLRSAMSAASLPEALVRAARPLRWSTMTILVVVAVLNFETQTQPYAHALFIPTAVVGSIAQVMHALSHRALARRSATS